MIKIGLFYTMEVRNMSFENGDNMFDYCGELFEKYKEDNNIFAKALQVFSMFQKRNDYPYCTEALSSVCERMLGCNLDSLTEFLWKNCIRLSDKMIWDPENTLGTEKYPDGNLLKDMSKEEGNRLAANFKNDMEVFFITLTPLFETLFDGESDLPGIDKIAKKQTYGDKKVIRFIRKDGETFDFSVADREIDAIINVLSQMKQ